MRAWQLPGFPSVPYRVGRNFHLADPVARGPANGTIGLVYGILIGGGQLRARDKGLVISWQFPAAPTPFGQAGQSRY
jgi:hypothetical protein